MYSERESWPCSWALKGVYLYGGGNGNGVSLRFHFVEKSICLFSHHGENIYT